MLFSEMIPLSQELTARGRLVTFETAGTLYLPVVCHLMSISPKLSNSTPPKSKNKRWHYRHDSDRHKPEVVYQLISEYDYQLKFVVESRKDCKEVEDYLDLLPEVPNHRVYMMPQGTDAEELRESETWLAPYCRKKGYRFCPRRQIEWFGPVRGT